MNTNADNTVSTAAVPNPAPLAAVSHIGKREKRYSALSFFSGPGVVIYIKMPIGIIKNNQCMSPKCIFKNAFWRKCLDIGDMNLFFDKKIGY